MAAERMKKVTNLLTCAVCYEMYKKPKYLPCHHSYCEECIVKLIKESKISCPECRETNNVPPEGVADLPNNFFINNLMDEVTLKRKVDGEEKATCDMCVEEGSAIVLCPECVMFLCDHCNEYHKRVKDYRNHSVIPLIELQSKKEPFNLRPKAKPMLCKDHDLDLNFFCETCDQLVCHYCTTNEHNGHVHNSVKKMANKHRKEMEKIMEPVEKMIDDLSALRQKVTATGEEIGAQTTEVDQQIDLYYEELHRQLQQQREELKRKLQEMSMQKKKTISLLLEQLEYTQAQLESVKELNDAVTNGSDKEALFAKKQVSNDVKRLTECYKKLDTAPVELATIEFFPVAQYKVSFPQFGKIYDDHVAPDHCEVTDIPLQPLVGNKVGCKVITKDHNNAHCTKGGSDVIAQVQSSRGEVIPVEVKDNNDGSYSASFVTKHVGEVKLSVTIEGQHIKGSPYSIMVCRDYKSVDKPIKVVNDGGNMGYPWAIAFGRDGVWAVTDCNHHCVYIFDGQDQLVRKFGSSGSGNGQFSNPYGLAFDADNHLYVSEYSNNRVQKLSITGGHLLHIGYQGSVNGQLNSPIGITVHNERLYIAECSNSRISVFQLNGQFCSIIGSGQLRDPYDVTVSGNGHLLVADYNNNCITSFTLDGTCVGRFDKGQLSCPLGLTTDLNGFVLVTENGNSRVSVFDKDGACVCNFGSEGSANGRFSAPRGIAVSLNGNIYIAEYSNSRVQIF